MIRVLLTDDSLPVGGKETLLLSYLKRLDGDSFKVHLVTLTSKGELIAKAKEYSDHYLCLERKTGLDFSAIWRLRKYIKACQIQVVHTNQWIDSLYIYLSAFGLKLKKVSTIHGYISGWRFWIHRFILRRFDKVICVTDSSLEEIISRGYSSHNLVVVYNGINIDDFRREKSFPVNKKSIVIGMTGSFRKERDHLTLCKAIYYLIQSGKKEIEARLIGGALDPRCEMEVRQYCSENGLDNYIKFLGSRRDIREQLSQLDVYVASSHSETFGIGLIEAMACGLPVIVSDIPAFMEIVEHGKHGLYFKTTNYIELAQRIEELMQDKSLRNYYGELAYKRGVSFSIESSIQQLQILYKKLCES